MINEKLKIIINYQVVLSKDKNIKENCLIKNYKSIFYLIIKSICWRNKINHQSSIIRYRWERFSSGLQQAKWQTREQTGSEFTAHLRQDEAIPSALTSAPPRFSPVCLFFPSEPSFLLRAPIINQPRWMPGAHRRRRFLLPGGGTGRTGSARIWVSGEDNLQREIEWSTPITVPELFLSSSRLRVFEDGVVTVISKTNRRATSPLVRFVIVITGIDVARRIVPGKDEREHMADDDCCSRGLRKQT